MQLLPEKHSGYSIVQWSSLCSKLYLLIFLMKAPNLTQKPAQFLYKLLCSALCLEMKLNCLDLRVKEKLLSPSQTEGKKKNQPALPKAEGLACFETRKASA